VTALPYTDIADFRLLPDSGGLIETVAIVLPPVLLSAQAGRFLQNIRAALASLAMTLPSGVTLVVLTERSARDVAGAWLDGLDLACTLEIAATVDDGALNEGHIWIQDAFHVAVNSLGVRLYRRTRSDNDGRLATWLAAHDGTRVHDTPLHLTGGNMLAGEDRKILGFKNVEATARSHRPPIETAAACALLRAFDPLPVFFFGHRYAENSADFHRPVPSMAQASPSPAMQPGVHLDLVVSWTGVMRQGKPVLLVADRKDGLDPALSGRAPESRAFDACAIRAERWGYQVVRNPVPYLPFPGSQGIAGPVPRFYNNVLVENERRPHRDRPLVWVPCFGDVEPGLAAYDKANGAIWEALGFEVRPVFGWGPLSNSCGAIRCACKVLKRARPL